MASPADAQAAGVARTEQEHLEGLAIRLAGALSTLFLGLSSVDDVALAGWLTATAPSVTGAQEGSVNAAYAYGRIFTDLAGVRIGHLPEPGGIVGALRRGASVEQVYTRPITTARWALSNGHDFATAMRMGANNAAALARTDVASAWRAGSAAARSVTPRCTGYTRVTGAKACHYCLLMATSTFSPDHVAPAHTNCNCAEAPVIGRLDPGAATRGDALSTLDIDQATAAQQLDAMPTVPAEAGPSTP